METTQIKEEIMHLVGAEVDQWLERQDKIKDGYEYEDQFMTIAQKVNRIIFCKSMGKIPRDRNKKNFRPV